MEHLRSRLSVNIIMTLVYLDVLVLPLKITVWDL